MLWRDRVEPLYGRPRVMSERNEIPFPEKGLNILTKLHF